MGFAPEPQELRAKKIGRVLIDLGSDQPWSQYFCCMAAANRDFLRKNPVATKRALRALLKAADLCVSDPVRAARLMVDLFPLPILSVPLWYALVKRQERSQRVEVKA